MILIIFVITIKIMGVFLKKMSISLILVLFSAVFFKNFLLKILKYFVILNFTYIIYIDMLLLFLATILIYYLFEVYNSKSLRISFTRDIFYKSFTVTLLYFLFRNIDIYSILSTLILMSDVIVDYFLLIYKNLVSFFYFKLFGFSVNPSSSQAGPSQAGPSSQAKETGSDVEEVSTLDYFNSLIKKRAIYMSKYEYYSKRLKETETIRNRAGMDKYGRKLDQLEVEIEELKDKEGFADPADFLRSPDASDNE